MEKLKQVFREILNLDTDFDVTTAEYQKVGSWDSVAHMGLIAAIEDTFGIMIDTDDVIDMSSFKVAVDIVKKYGVSLNA